MEYNKGPEKGPWDNLRPVLAVSMNEWDRPCRWKPPLSLSHVRLSLSLSLSRMIIITIIESSFLFSSLHWNATTSWTGQRERERGNEGIENFRLEQDSLQKHRPIVDFPNAEKWRELNIFNCRKTRRMHQLNWIMYSPFNRNTIMEIRIILTTTKRIFIR